MEEIIELDVDEEEKSKKQLCSLPKLRNLILTELPKLETVCGNNGVMVADSLQKVEVFRCSKLKKIVSRSKLLCELKILEEIDVQYCYEIEEVIALDGDDDGEGNDRNELILPKLKSLTLEFNSKLKSICGSNGVIVGDCLQNIVVSFCKKLKNIASTSKPLLELKKIQVRNCDEMEEIIASDHVEKEDNSKKQLSLPRLERLSLYQMPKMKSILCGSNRVMVCESFRSIQMRGCPSLKHLSFSLPLDENGLPSPPISSLGIEIDRSLWESVEWDHPNTQALLLPCRQLDR